ncbi:MAG: response regulator [Candidatus Polarisedimenticolaceae bacterium]|nr:response regulator [Candidatus Polarisedimenticolaceae bacterium]
MSTKKPSTILLVEDNELSREMLSRRLQREGYLVSTANDGSQAITSATKLAPDLILMDMSLPVVDGWEATKKLKSGSTTKNIPIIGLSAHALTSDQAKALEAGCDSYDTKPVNLSRLIAQIEQLV